MTQLFLPYNLALLAKEKGFNEPCFAMWQKNKKLWFAAKNQWLINFVIEPDKDTLEFQKINYPQNVLTINGKDLLINSTNFTAPLYQQIIDWFREKDIKIVELPATNPIKWAVIKNGEFKGGYEINKAIEEAFKLI